MRRATVLLLLAVAFSLNGQALVCPANSAGSGRPCEVFHYHVQMYDPETKQFTTLVGVNQYASQAACDTAREVRARQNASVVDYVKRVKTQQYEGDRIGPCHCDMSIYNTSATYLTDLQRLAQKRAAENVRRRVRAKLLDLDLPGDSELITGLSPEPASNAMLAGPRLTQVPSGPGAVADHQPTDLRIPRAAPNGAPSTAAIDLPLAEISTVPASRREAATAAPVAVPHATPAISETTVKFDAAPSQPPATEPTKTITATSSETPEPATTEPALTEPASASSQESSISAEDSADAFIRHETQRIQNVVNAITDPPDDAGEKVLEACTLRLQALSNLRSLILGSGARSRIAQVARMAGPDSERLQLVTKLFGAEIAAHWMPKVTTDVLIAAKPLVDASPEKVLRDSSAQFAEGEKKRALYMLLSRAAITEEQQLWLIPVVEGFLQ